MKFANEELINNRIRAKFGVNLSDSDIEFALERSDHNVNRAIEFIRDHPTILTKRTSTGFRVSAEETVTRLISSYAEVGELPEYQDFYLVGGKLVTAISTTRGNKLVDNEIVYFKFPEYGRQKFVRFYTSRSGELGRLPMELTNSIMPLNSSGKIEIIGRCVAAPETLQLMQEVLLYVSFYVHKSVFKKLENPSTNIEAPAKVNSYEFPLLSLFNLINFEPNQKAEFCPSEIGSRKRSLSHGGGDEAAMLPLLKRRNGGQQPEQDKEEQAITESTLNKLLGAMDTYDLKEIEPPSELRCVLKPYQKQALYWMLETEQCSNKVKGSENLHPLWACYRLSDKRAGPVYVNIVTGEATTQFPAAMEMTKGGILADAMGLGKTVMTIALILSRPLRGYNFNSDDEYLDRAKGGTLIICPMALLGQWKDELETHSKPDSITIFVHYGGCRTTNPRVIADNDVVLTTYGTLTESCKNGYESSIFHRVHWYRVVLDEAHTIKSSKTQAAKAAFMLSANFRWCLTGTPLQNDLEDLYSLLCFLKVEPWGQWPWWQKLIQKPYENGDPRGLKLIKAILRPLMLRRTKETKDKLGRPILVLPLTDIQIIKCEQSEAEQDFYNALFRRSKVQFDDYVAQGKVLSSYASILELLLRLRQCCNHPFLVMSRADSQQYVELNKLARRFVDPDADSATSSPSAPSDECIEGVIMAIRQANSAKGRFSAPTQSYIDAVINGIRQGENNECPICMESADDPVLTPCAHRMCRECLISCWNTGRSQDAGPCPICRKSLKKTDFISCPVSGLGSGSGSGSGESKFQLDIEENWKESSKVAKLMECLGLINESETGEKSIVFSQWTSFLDLLEIALRKRKMGFLRYDGKLTQKQREKTVNEFNETKEKTVMLMSLKAGGVGLNLTAASNVFLMDPWWNPAVEEQAIMRIHRIGQKRTVSVVRLIVENTVEERFQQIKAKKQRMISGALMDEEVRTARIEDLKMMFRY